MVISDSQPTIKAVAPSKQDVSIDLSLSKCNLEDNDVNLLVLNFDKNNISARRDGEIVVMCHFLNRFPCCCDDCFILKNIAKDLKYKSVSTINVVFLNW